MNANESEVWEYGTLQKSFTNTQSSYAQDLLYLSVTQPTSNATTESVTTADLNPYQIAFNEKIKGVENENKFLHTQLPSVNGSYANTLDEISVLLEKNRSIHKEINIIKKVDLIDTLFLSLTGEVLPKGEEDEEKNNLVIIVKKESSSSAGDFSSSYTKKANHFCPSRWRG